jgi:hypothetical protein
VFLGRDAGTKRDVAVKVEDLASTAAGGYDANDHDDHGDDRSGEERWDSSGSWDYGCGSWEEEEDGGCSGGGGASTPLELEHTAMTRVTRVSGPAVGGCTS